jgi:hypothetical protein
MKGEVCGQDFFFGSTGENFRKKYDPRMGKQLAISPHHAHYVMRYVAAQIRNYQG